MAIYGHIWFEGKTRTRNKTIIYWLFIEKNRIEMLKKNHIWPVFEDTLRIHFLVETSDIFRQNTIGMLIVVW